MRVPLHLALLVAVLSTTNASAQDTWVDEDGVRHTSRVPPPAPDHFWGTGQWFDPHGLYLSLGGTVGSAWTSGEGAVQGVHGGGQLSLTYEWFPWGLGGYVDATYADATGHTRVSAGAQFLFAMLGVDLGYVAALDDAGTTHGLQYSIFVTFGFLGAQFRQCVLFDERDELEGTFFVKVPFEIFAKFRGWGFWFAGWH